MKLRGGFKRGVQFGYFPVHIPTGSLYESDGSINTDYLNDLNDYFTDTFALRQKYITSWYAINSGLLHNSVELQVTLGGDGGLFYTSTFDDYQGSTHSDRY